jgi:thiamine pyrophosphate-dependent acetolactate synthase large subunit-like protein
MPNLSGRIALLDQLVADGVTHVFGNPGTTEQAFMDALQDYPQIQYILALQESVATGVADGYSRASGRPSFLQLHINPGLGNAIGMLYNSYRTGTPMVVYAGQHPQRGASQEPILAGDLVKMAAPVTKWAAHVEDAAEVPVLLRRAFKVAMEPPRGPVFLSIPANIMDEEAEVEITPTAYTNTRVRPDPEAIERVAEALAGARSPVIVCGDGVATSGAIPELVRLAEALGARVHYSFSAELPFPADHPLCAGILNVISEAALKGQLSAADVIIAVGTPVFTLLFPLHELPFQPGTQVVQIHADPWEISKSWPAQHGIVADPKLALADLLPALEKRLTPAHREAAQQRTQAVQTMAQQFMQAMDASAQGKWDNVPIAPARMAKELADAMAPGTVLFDESITAGGHLMRHVRMSEPGTHYRATGGGLGPGMPNPIGIKLARPDRPVLSIVGDGAALYTIQALWTAAHHRVPVTWVIANNASYRILKLNMLEYLGEGAAGRDFVAMDLVDPPVDFPNLAASFGVKGVRVERPDEIGEALREAQAAEEPRLVDIAIDGDIRSRWL